MRDRGTIARTAERLLLLALVLLAWVTLGCAGERPVLSCPGAGGPAWRRLTTPRFVLATDLPPPKAEQVALDLETSWIALRTALGAPSGEASVRLVVVVFERWEDFAAISGSPGMSGYYASRIPGEVELQPAIVFSGGLGYKARRTLQHELTHAILRSRTSRLPWWLDEGLAETYSTLRIEDNRAIVGEPPRDVEFWEGAHVREESALPIPKKSFPVSWAPPVTDLTFADRASVEESGQPRLYYMGAWKLMHVLRGHLDARHAPRFRAMLRSLMSGTPGSQAFAEAYGTEALEHLGKAYSQILLDRREVPEAVTLSLPAAAQPVVTPMSDGEVHALWAQLAAGNEPASISAEDEIRRGLAENPGDRALLYARASTRLRRKDASGAQLDIWELRRTDHRDPRYLSLDLFGALLWMHGQEDDEAAEFGLVKLSAVVNELLPVAVTPGQRLFAALALSRLRRRAEALEVAAKAIEADPTCSACFLLRAGLLLGSGQPAAAAEAMERARTLIPDELAPSGLDDLREQIERELASPPER